MQLELTFSELEEKAACEAENHAPQQNSKLSEEMRRERARESSRRSKQKHRAAIAARRKTPEALKKMADYMRGWRTQLTDEQKEGVRKTHRKWCGAHRDSRKKQNEASRKRHWDRVLKNSRDYRKNNGEKVRAFFREYLPDYRAEQRRNNPQFLLAERMRARLKRALSDQALKKPATTEAIIGCTISELKTHIEAQFVNGMTWSRGDSFAVDHIVPIIAFDLTDAEERYWSFNWRNLRPLDPIENKRKSATLPTPLPSWLPSPIAERILARQKPIV